MQSLDRLHAELKDGGRGGGRSPSPPSTAVHASQPLQLKAESGEIAAGGCHTPAPSSRWANWPAVSGAHSAADALAANRGANCGSSESVDISALAIACAYAYIPQPYASAAAAAAARAAPAPPRPAVEQSAGPQAAAIGQAIDVDRDPLEHDRFPTSIGSAGRHDGRPLAPMRVLLPAAPAGPDAEAPTGSKRAISGQELQSGGFLGVAKRLREVPPPLTPPVPPPGTPPPAGFFDSDQLTAAALRAETIIRSPLSTPVSTPPSEPGPTSPQSEPTPPQSASTPVPSPPPPPADSRFDLERELEALHIAKDIAGEDEPAEIKPPELAPFIMAVGERKDVIHNIVRRTMDELVSRGQRSGRSHPSLASLSRLAKLLSRLDAAGLENPSPPPYSHTLFAMDVLEQPDIARWGEPLSGWFPPPDYGEKYVAAVEHAFEAIKRTREASLPAAVSFAVARLIDDRLLLCPLVRTFAGRIRFRALLVILREAAVSMAPVMKVAKHLTTAALRRLSWRSGDREDAVRSAWDAVDALRPVMRNAPPDLFPITFPHALEVLGAAAETANKLVSQPSSSEAAAAAQLLYAEALARIGEQEAMAGLLQEAIAHLFEAWALLLREGASPSRLESRIILSLTDAHQISPTASQLAERLYCGVPTSSPMTSQLAERVYWCRESDEDLHTAARACCLLAHLSGAAGRAEEAKQYAARVFEIVESMPPEQRECEAVSFVAASIAIMACVRTGHMDECFSYARLAVKERSKHSDGAHPALDSSSGAFRVFKGPTLDACLEMFRFGLFLYAVCDPNEMTGVHVASAIGAMGEIYARQGQWRRAAMCYAESLERNRRFRKAFPTDHPRVVRMTAALKRCEREDQSCRAAAASKLSPPPTAGDVAVV